MRRIFVEKKEGFNSQKNSLLSDLKENLKIQNLDSIRLLNRYDFEDLSEEIYQSTIHSILSEPPVDQVFENTLPISGDEVCFAIEYLPGQFDQRADSAAQCIQILTQNKAPALVSARVVVLNGQLTSDQISKIKTYCINPVDSREASLDLPKSLQPELPEPKPVKSLDGFVSSSAIELESLRQKMGLAMSLEDLLFTQNYYIQSEDRDPTITEIKVLDTYWSDHCRHTTFLTEITSVEFQDSAYKTSIEQTYKKYQEVRSELYTDKVKHESLMDIALIATKALRKSGKLEDLEVSEEINACSIVVPVKIDGIEEDWLVMFKNETHNHPTEIEPFGGAATCLGGCIRDPLSGRSYVYQAMRVTGAADPTQKVEETLPGKLPQRKITQEAAHGYSSYGNQIGLATGLVHEIYHSGYLAKRMEIGAVIAAAPKKNVRRESPEAGDKIVLLGGRTGRDGVGGATGSSKEHTESALENSAEVQKGNAPTERKIQRLFRNEAVSRLIKKCNDFGAGGVSVAIGELADSLEVYLDKVPLKYYGLDGTELSISESQERMAVVLDPKDVEAFLAASDKENLEAVEVAEVTNSQRLRMHYKGQVIVDLERTFLDSNGVAGATEIEVEAVESPYSAWIEKTENTADHWKKTLQNLNNCNQQGLIENFDSTIGASAVLHPFGGHYRKTPSEGMASKIPTISGDCDTATVMTHGFDPYLSSWSPFHGALYAELHSLAKIVAIGADYRKARLTLQEYFKKLGQDKKKWGQPFSALLGAFWLQEKLDIPAIGGKDSMSGSFKDLEVPPTLVSFAVSTTLAKNVLSPEFKAANHSVYLLPVERCAQDLPLLENLIFQWQWLHTSIQRGEIASAHTVGFGGIATTLAKMAWGNRIGVDLKNLDLDLFRPEYGAIVIELNTNTELPRQAIELGKTMEEFSIREEGVPIVSLMEALESWEATLEPIFPQKAPVSEEMYAAPESKVQILKSKSLRAKPLVFLPVFPGSNCEYDTAKAFEQAGASVDTFIFRNQSALQIEESIQRMEKGIQDSQILMLAGGFSAGDEPDGSGKFIATLFRNQKIAEATMDLLKNRDGLALGICNGFQALIKLGLVPYGEIRDLSSEAPTLTYNNIGRHISGYVDTKIVSTLSPWLSGTNTGETHSIAVSHGEGKFVASEALIHELAKKGQIATQYVDPSGIPSRSTPYNPNGSYLSVEGITSEDGRIFGKMGHSERIGKYVGKNIHGNKDQRIFTSGVKYFS